MCCLELLPHSEKVPGLKPDWGPSVQTFFPDLSCKHTRRILANLRQTNCEIMHDRLTEFSNAGLPWKIKQHLITLHEDQASSGKLAAQLT